MANFITAQEFVDFWGVVEIGQLLTNNLETINPTGNTRADFVAVMFDGGVEENGLTILVTEQLDNYINDAQSELDSILSLRYKTPLTDSNGEIITANVPVFFKSLSKKIVRYLMHDRISDEFDIVRINYKHAIDQAQSVAKGKLTPFTPSTLTVASINTSSPVFAI